MIVLLREGQKVRRIDQEKKTHLKQTISYSKPLLSQRSINSWYQVPGVHKVLEASLPLRRDDMTILYESRSDVASRRGPSLGNHHLAGAMFKTVIV